MRNSLIFDFHSPHAFPPPRSRHRITGRRRDDRTDSVQCRHRRRCRRIVPASAIAGRDRAAASLIRTTHARGRPCHERTPPRCRQHSHRCPDAQDQGEFSPRRHETALRLGGPVAACLGRRSTGNGFQPDGIWPAACAPNAPIRCRRRWSFSTTRTWWTTRKVVDGKNGPVVAPPADPTSAETRDSAGLDGLISDDPEIRNVGLFAGGFGPGFPGSPGFVGSVPGGNIALPSPMTNPVTPVMNN